MKTKSGAVPTATDDEESEARATAELSAPDPQDPEETLRSLGVLVDSFDEETRKAILTGKGGW